jgi:hypothetical protein
MTNEEIRALIIVAAKGNMIRPTSCLCYRSAVVCDLSNATLQAVYYT